MTPSEPLGPPPSSRGPADSTVGTPRLLPGQLRLDELLADLLERVQDLQGQRQRLRMLLDDVVGIATGLSLEETLHRIVEAARALVDARYAALAVLAPDGGLQQSITAGTDAPGSPPSHPPTRSFLGVPITVRGILFGHLHLTEKISRADFDEDDEQLVVALAGAAGIAIENARLFEQAELRQRWLRAGIEVSHDILAAAEDRSTVDGHGPSLIVDSASQVTEDDLVAVWMFVADGSDALAAAGLICRAAAGPGSKALIGSVIPAGTSIATQVTKEGTARFVADLGSERSAWRPPAEVPALGSALFLPLTAESGPLGVLVLARTTHRPPHSADEADVAQGYATQAGLALALAARQQDRRQLAVLADRDRIARDLHDQVIQQLFASGLSLQGLTGTLPPAAAVKVEQVVQSLDDTIGDLRRAIFALHTSTADNRGLRNRLVDVTAQAASIGTRKPRLRLDGPLDSVVPDEVADDVVAVVREALSNAARHAQARSAEVAVSLRAGSVFVVVTDDGRGLPPVLVRQSGLQNLRARAEAHGGSFIVEPGPDGHGTSVRWQAPTG